MGGKITVLVDGNREQIIHFVAVGYIFFVNIKQRLKTVLIYDKRVIFINNGIE